MRPAQQWIDETGTGDLGHQRETDILSGIEHGPFLPWLITGISQPGAEIGIADNQGKDGGSQSRGLSQGRVQQGCCQSNERPPHRASFTRNDGQ